MEIVQREGERCVKRLKKVYNLDVIIVGGFRVNSLKPTKFISIFFIAFLDYTIREGY